MSMTQYDHQNNACHIWDAYVHMLQYFLVSIGSFRQFWVWVLWFQTEAPSKCVHPTEVMNLPLPEGSNSQLQLSLVKLAQDEKNTCVGPLIPHGTPTFDILMLRSSTFDGEIDMFFLSNSMSAMF